MSDYPTDRQPMFAIRYIRWLSDSGAAAEVGPDAFALLVAVATKEDELHYSRAPNFFNDQLASRCGIISIHALARARQRAIDAKLLRYEAAAKRRPGRYFVDGFYAQSAENTPESSAQSAGNAGGITDPPYPIPDTQYKKRPQFKKPTVGEIKAYCQERHNSVNADQFHDHYAANGWVQSKGAAIRDWKAAVRTWERNGLFTKPTNGKPDPSLQPFPARSRA